LSDYPKIAQFKDVASFQRRIAELGISLPIDGRILTAADGSPLAEPLAIAGFRVGNRWCIHPMEGWDANPDGSPSELTLRRWKHFGLSGAKWIWGGEAAAVQPDGRANPRQTLAVESNRAGLAQLLETCRAAHREAFGADDDLFVGLQLTHSGRFSRPNSKQLEPRIVEEIRVPLEREVHPPGKGSPVEQQRRRQIDPRAGDELHDVLIRMSQIRDLGRVTAA